MSFAEPQTPKLVYALRLAQSHLSAVALSILGWQFCLTAAGALALANAYLPATWLLDAAVAMAAGSTLCLSYAVHRWWLMLRDDRRITLG